MMLLGNLVTLWGNFLFMNGTCSFCPRSAPCLTAIAGLVLIGMFALSKGPAGPAAKRDAQAVRKMVDDIVNRNKAPELVDRPRGSPETVPLFPKGYDWAEEKRVLKALDRLYQNSTVELWEELVRKVDDPRYCVVVRDGQAADAEIRSVGDVCKDLANSRLVDVFCQHLPDDPNKPGTIYLDVGTTYIAAWRKRRADKSLYQLQIEVCEVALRELSRDERVSEKEKTSARKKIDAEITKLRRTKQPVFLKYPSFRGFELVYTPEQAKLIRENVKSGFSGQINLCK
ncbi:MAG TPA: hypothetical protein VG013_04660 [Gemmataceae bacterium]|jgi:hypothetical protein|nr:hypothetical protein [Gemmataceae bacterium]